MTTPVQPLPPSPPATLRGKIVYFMWSNIPRVLLLGLLALIALLVIRVQEEKAAIAEAKAAEVKVEKPPVNTITLTLHPTEIVDRINLPGAVEPWTDLSLLSKLGGTIDKVLVQEGDTVRQDQVIAHIESDDYSIALDRAEAAYKLAQDDYRRMKAMFDKGAIPSATFESQRATLTMAKADYEHSKLQLSRTDIRAPMAGIIRSLTAKVGLQLAVGDPVAEIYEIERMKGVVGIPESDVSAVRTLTGMEITIQALNDLTLDAKSHFLSPAPNNVARLYNLELEIPNKDGAILSGMFFRADVVKSRHANSLVVPFYSVISRNDEQYVFIEKNGLAVKKPVKLGIMEQWRMEITEGLAPGDRVLIEGHRDVEDGQEISVIRNVAAIEELKR